MSGWVDLGKRLQLPQHFCLSFCSWWLSLRSDVLLHRKQLNSVLQNAVAPFLTVPISTGLRLRCLLSEHLPLKIMFWRRRDFWNGWPTRVLAKKVVSIVSCRCAYCCPESIHGENNPTSFIIFCRGNLPRAKLWTVVQGPGHDGKLQPHRVNISPYRVWHLACWW